MAKKQHGTVATLSRKIHSEKMTNNFNETFDSSDEDAPEEVTFEDSKASALQSIKEALETARREKLLLKEKRRRRQELFQEQKKKRLLPADVLEEIDSVQPNLKGNYSVVTVKHPTPVMSQQKAAMDFLQSRLYGPESRRTTSSELLSLQNKTAPKKSAAVQFVKKDWAKEPKLKAEKLKKQWIHKQTEHH
ncbi:U3 small nucleolar RNA-associated protein NOL7 [Aplochiton taeniatus]